MHCAPGGHARTRGATNVARSRKRHSRRRHTHPEREARRERREGGLEHVGVVLAGVEGEEADADDGGGEARVEAQPVEDQLGGEPLPVLLGGHLVAPPVGREQAVLEAARHVHAVAQREEEEEQHHVGERHEDEGYDEGVRDPPVEEHLVHPHERVRERVVVEHLPVHVEQLHAGWGGGEEGGVCAV